MASLRSVPGYLRRKGYTPVRTALAFVVFGGGLLTTAYFFRPSPDSNLIEADLEREFASINAMPNAFLTGRLNFSKVEGVAIWRNYETSLSHAEVRGHYNGELSNHGWRLCAEEKKRSYVIIETGKTRTIYCKRNYQASLEFHDEVSGSGNGFSLELSWDRW